MRREVLDVESCSKFFRSDFPASFFPPPPSQFLPKENMTPIPFLVVTLHCQICRHSDVIVIKLLPTLFQPPRKIAGCIKGGEGRNPDILRAPTFIGVHFFTPLVIDACHAYIILFKVQCLHLAH